MVVDEREVYGVGSNGLGELDGESIHYRSSEPFPRKVLVPTRGSIVRVKAKNSRSCAFTDQGEVWYWGGLTLQEKGERPHQIEGFRLLNREVEGLLKTGERIVDFEMGYAHDVLLTEKSPQ